MKAFYCPDWVLEAKAPNKQFSEFNNSTLGAVADGFDGTVAWSKNQSGVRVKEGEELAKTKRDADFYRCLNLKVTSRTEHPPTSQFKGAGTARPRERRFEKENLFGDEPSPPLLQVPQP